MRIRFDGGGVRFDDMGAKVRLRYDYGMSRGWCLIMKLGEIIKVIFLICPSLVDRGSIGKTIVY
jgi:hypothetical protein